jgi:sulfite exporter TauE/SafE
MWIKFLIVGMILGASGLVYLFGFSIHPHHMRLAIVITCIFLVMMGVGAWAPYHVWKARAMKYFPTENENPGPGIQH